MYGPTTSDRVRLGDTGLLIAVERDYCVYGGEYKLGFGKVLCSGPNCHSSFIGFRPIF